MYLVHHQGIKQEAATNLRFNIKAAAILAAAALLIWPPKSPNTA